MKRTEVSNIPAFSSIGQPLPTIYQPVYIPQRPVVLTSIPVELTPYTPQSGHGLYQNESVLCRRSDKKLLLKRCCCCLDLRMGAIGIAGFNVMLGISILFMNGSDYEDWFILYSPATSAVISGVFLLYGSIFNQRTATLLYLIFSTISIIFYAIAAIVLFTLYHPVGMTIGFLFLIIGLLNVYFWFCVFSFYHILKG